MIRFLFQLMTCNIRRPIGLILPLILLTIPANATSPCEEGYIATHVKDNPSTITFLSALDQFGSATNQIDVTSTLRLDYPLKIQVKFSAPIHCSLGQVSLHTQRDSSAVKTMDIAAIDDSLTTFESKEFSLIWEEAAEDSQIQWPQNQEKPQLIVKIRDTPTPLDFKRYAKQSRRLLPAFKEGFGDLEIRLVNKDGRPLKEALVRQAQVTAKKEGETQEISFLNTNRFVAREIQSGKYDITVAILGSTIQKEGVTVRDRQKTESILGGAQHFGEVGFSDKDYEYFVSGFYNLTPFECQYSKDGNVTFTQFCYKDPLPPGKYELQITQTLFPVSQSLTIKAGESLTLKPQMGYLFIHESSNKLDSGRELKVSVRQAREFAQPFTFRRESRTILPEGRYYVEVVDAVSGNKYSSEVTIAAAVATYFPLDKRTNETSLYYNPTGTGLQPGVPADFGSLMDE